MPSDVCSWHRSIAGPKESALALDHGEDPEEGLYAHLLVVLLPSFFVSAGAAITEVDTYKFLSALIMGKLVMIYILSSIGFHLGDMLDRPLRSILILVAIAIIWVVLEKVVKIDERI